MDAAGMTDAEVFGSAPATSQQQLSAGGMSDADVFGSTKPEEHAKPAPLSWGDVPGQALSNLPASAGNLISNTVHPFLHPIQTAESFYDLGKGLVSKAAGAAGVSQDPKRKAQDEASANAVGAFFKDRYGSIEGVKRAMATDPAGVLGDAASVLTLGEGALGRAPGIVGDVAKAAGRVGREINPLNAPINAANAGIRGVNKGINAAQRMTAPVSAEAEANNYVSKVLPPDKLDAFAAATAGKPAMAAEATRPGINGLRSLGLRQGETGDTLSAALQERASGTGERLMSDYEAATGVDPHAARGDIDSVVQAGRTKADPLYKKAFAGSGTGAFVKPLEAQFSEHSSATNRAASAVADAERGVTLAEAKLHRAGDNVYGVNSANTELADANNHLEAAQAAQTQAEAAKEGVLVRMRHAQADEAAGVRGGVWSPRIQQFLDDPILKRGIAQGLEIQRLEALKEGKVLNARDYAITGTDQEGLPIISGVPNMRVLDAGKRGLDQIIRAANTDQFGRYVPTERGNAIDGVRQAYLKELDTLNPDYGKARAVASDYLGAKSAFDRTAKMFSSPNITSKELQTHIDGLGETDQVAARGGIANLIFNKAQNGTLRPQDFSKPIMRQKVTAIIGDKAKADALLKQAATEAALAKSGARMAPGVNSATFETGEAAADQDRAGAAMDVGHAALKLASGKKMAALNKGASALQKMGAFARTPGMSIPVRDEAGRLMMMPPSDLAAHLRAPPPPMPLPKMRGLIPQGGRLGLLGAAQAGQIVSQSPYRRGGFV